MTIRSSIILAWIAALSILPAEATFSNSPSLFEFLAAFERSDGTIDNVQLWSQIGITSHLFHEYPKADLFTLETETNGWKMLRLSDRWSSQWQYVLFRLNTNGLWCFAGNVDLSNEHHETPVHHLEALGDRIWLVLEHISNYGTGVFIREGAWYPLNTSVGASELRYLHDGRFVDPDGMLQQYVLLHQGCSITNKHPVVELLHRVTVQSTDEKGDVRVVHQKDIRTRFEWSDEKKKFEAAGLMLDPRILYYTREN